MTIEEAIEQLENLEKCETYLWSKDIQAIDIAIKAIEENKELKRLLRLAIEDIKICLICECVYKICSEQACHCSTNAQCKKICKWKHADEAMKILGE